MAFRALEFGFIIRAFDMASGVIAKLEAKMAAFNESVKKAHGLREIGTSFMQAGAVIGGAGAVIGYGLKGTVDAAMNVEATLAHVQTAMNDGAATTKNLAEVHAFMLAQAQKGVISEGELGQSYYIARSAGLSHAAALALVATAQNSVTATTKNAADANAAMADTTRTLAEVQNATGIGARDLADRLSILQTKYAFKDITEVTDALKYVTSSAKAAGVDINTTSAAVAVLSQNMVHGGQAGQVLRQVLIAFTKGGAHGRLLPYRKEDAAGNFELVESFQALQAHLATLGPTARLAFLSEAGFQARSIVGANILVTQIGKLAAIEKDMANSRAAAAQLAAIRMAATDEQLAKLGNSWMVLKATIGEQLLPAVTVLANAFAKLLVHIEAFAKAHPTFTKWAVTITAIGTAALIAVGGILLLAGGFLFAASALGIASASAAIFAALATGGLALGFIAIVGFAYEIYKHWNAIKSLWASIKAPDAGEGTTSLAIVETHGFLSAIGTAMEAAVTAVRWALDKIGKFTFDFLPKMYDFGVEMIEELGRGILRAATFNLSGPLKALGTEIMRWLPHSPAEKGPLQDLENVQIVETIAAAISRSHALVGNALSGVFGTAWQSIKSFAGAGAANILHGLMGTESSYGKMLTNPVSSAIGPYQMTQGFRQTWGVTPQQAMSMGTSTEIANKVIFGHYMPEFGGDIAKALSAWHQGEGWVRSHGVDSAYVNNVMRHTPASAAGNGGVTINVHYAPVIHGATPEDLKKHGAHIVRIVKDAFGRDSRLRYD